VKVPTRRYPGKRHFVLAGLLGAALAVLPVMASSGATPTVNATEEVKGSGLYAETTYHWTPPQVEVSSGGNVMFVNSSADVPHGIVWSGGPGTPACESSVPVGPEKSAPKWSGACTFAQAGTYTYYCSVHGPQMSGKVTVNANGTTTVTTTEPAPPGTTTTTSTTPPPAPQSPLAGSASQALKLAKSQRGQAVRGSLAISQAGAGGRLEIGLFAKSAFLATAKRGSVRVGRLVRSSVPAGKLSFSVALSARARRALHRHRRLSLTVKIVLAPPAGHALTIVRAVVLHG
jgi:plastocyanin